MAASKETSGSALAKIHGTPIAVRGASKTYATRSGEAVRALDPIDCDVASGEFISIVGPSGCGKSTLLLMIGGLLRCSQGSIQVGDALVTHPHPNSAAVFQRDLLLKWRNVLDNILLPVEIKKWKVADYVGRAERLMAQVGLQDFKSKFPDELSGGMRQRVAICRALVQEPRLLLMDEPFGALDALTREQMSVDLLKLWQQVKNTVIFVTHSVDEAVFLSDRVIVMTPRPGRVDLDLKIDLPRPRKLSIRSSPEFLSYVTTIRKAFEARGILVEE